MNCTKAQTLKNNKKMYTYLHSDLFTTSNVSIRIDFIKKTFTKFL